MAGTLHSFFRKVPKEQQQLKTPAPAKAGIIDLTEHNSRTVGSAKKSDRCTLPQSSGLESDAPTSAANLSPSEPLLKKRLESELHSTAKRTRLICAADAQRLSDAFAKDPNPSAQQRLALGSELGLTDEQIASWFANKRKTSERTDSTSKNTMQPLNDKTNTHSSQPSTSSARSQPGTSQSQPTNSHTAPDNSRTEPEEPESSAPPSGQPSSSEQPPAKRQKTASPDLVLSMEERKVLGAQYSAEADDLRAALSSCWLRDHAPDILRPPPAASASAPDSKLMVLNKAEVALLVEGRHEPLSQLCAIVNLQLAPRPEATDAHPEAPATSPLPPPTINQQAVREMIIDVATRSSNITPAAAEADPQEAAGGAGQWRWEVRDLKLLPKPARDFVELARKRRKQLKDRLGKVEEVGRLLLAPTSTKAHGGKISRAMARAEKAGGLEVVEGACQESLSALFTKHSMQREAVVQKEAAKKEKEEHKRAAEEARKKAEEERRLEAERHKQERAAEKEKQRAEREAKKVEEEAKHTGFGSKGALNKSRSILQNFFKPNAKPAVAATPTAATPSAPPSTPAPKASQDPSQKPLFDIPPIPRSDASKAFQVELDAVVATGQLPGPAVVAALEGFKASWRAQRPLATRLPGAPPTWARRPGPPEAFPAMLEKYYGEGAEQRAVRTWRRKLLHHHTSLRPAYYGSFSRTSTEVRGRRPLGQDPSLDYEVMSDEDWEDEPEGESLSEDDGGEEEAKGGEEDEEMDDGFVVDDGYLSEDEGFQGGPPGEEDMMDVDDPARVVVAGPEGAWGPAAVQPADPRLQQLEVAMERARRTNRPLLLTALPSIQAPAAPSSLDSALLSLRAIVLAPPPAAVTVPSDADADAVPFGQAAAADRGAGGKPRPAVALAPGVVEQLVAFLQATAEKGLDKVVAAFQAAHPSPRPPSKSRLKDAIRALAVYKGGRWVLESSSPPKHSTDNHPPPAPAAGTFQRLATPAKTPAAPPPTTHPHTTAATNPHPPTQPHPTPPPPARLPTATSLPSAIPTPAAAPTSTPTATPPASTPQAAPSSKHPAPSKPANGIKSYFSTSKAPAPQPHATPASSQNHTTRPSATVPSSSQMAPHNKRKGGSPVKRCTSAPPPPEPAAAGAVAPAGAATPAAPAAAAAAAADTAVRVGAAPASARGVAAEGAAEGSSKPAAGQARREEGGEGSGGAPPPGNQV